MEWGFISLQKLSFLDFFKRRIFVFCPNFPAWRRATLRLFLREEDFSLDFDLTWRFLFKTFLITTALSCQHPRNIVVLCCIWVQTTPVSVTVSWVGGSIDGKHWLCCDTTTAADQRGTDLPFLTVREPSHPEEGHAVEELPELQEQNNKQEVIDDELLVALCWQPALKTWRPKAHWRCGKKTTTNKQGSGH